VHPLRPHSRSRLRTPLTTNYARIVPKNFYHDSEELYSELIKLKQKTNSTADENTRLKTKIAILEKEKAKLARRLQGDGRARGISGAQLTGGQLAQSVEVPLFDLTQQQQHAENTKLINLQRMLQ
jgi:hypothetical protein